MFKNGPYSGKLLTKTVRDSLGLNPLGGGTPGGFTKLFWPSYSSNGYILQSRMNTDLHLVADDLAIGSNWVSRQGGHTATLNGQPSIGLETPFYPSGGFNGSGFRTSASVFSAADYYAIPNNINNIIQNNDDVTYEIIMKTGDFSAGEILVSQPVPAGSGYNFYIATVNSFLNPMIEIVVGHDAGDAIVQFDVSRYCFYYLKIAYQFINRQLTVQVNGRGGNFAGVGAGNLSTGGVEPYYIGCGTAGASPAVSSQIIELQRHRGLIADTPEGYNRATRFFGVHDTYGVIPTNCIRESKAAIEVNNKLWQVGLDWPCLNHKGRLSEAISTNYLANSIFSETFGTGYNFYSPIGLSYAADPDDHKSSGGTGLKFENDLGGTFHGVWQDVGLIGAGSPCYFYCEWKALTLNAQAYFIIYNAATANYYDVVTQTWGAATVFNKPGNSSLQKIKYQLNFNNDSSLGHVLVGLCNTITDFNTDSFIYFLWQFSDGFPTPCSPLIYETVTGDTTKYRDCVTYSEADSIKYVKGAFSAEISFLNSSTDTNYYNKTILGGNSEFMYLPSPSTSIRLSDSINNTDISPVYSREQILLLSGYWGISSTMKLQESMTGAISNNAFTSPLNSGDLGVGGTNDPTFFATWLQPGAYIRNLKIWREP